MRIRTILMAAPLFLASFQAFSAQQDKTCHGNIETLNKKIIQSGVTYTVSYEVNGAEATVKFADREFKAVVDTGKAWQGPWIRSFDEEHYFSFQPDNGGAIKYQFEANKWFSGTC